MSGEVSKSRQKKAGSSGSTKKGQNSGAQAAANLKYANKKKLKEKNNQKMAPSKSSGFCSCWTLIVMLTLTGVAMASYHHYPEKVKEVYDSLPPQVKRIFLECLDFAILSLPVLPVLTVL